MSSADIYPAEERCPICGYSGIRPRRSLLQRSPEIYLLLCGRCKGLSASYLPTQAALQDYYSTYYANRSSSEHLVTFHQPERMAKHILSGITLATGEEYRILDFGGGDGTIGLSFAKLVAAHSQRNIRVQVVDFVKHQHRQEGAISLEVVHNLDEAMADCHCIIASSIFEHIPELGPVLSKIMGKMKPGGYMYARTPYVLPFMRLLGVDMTYPAHVHDLGDAFWNSIPAWLDMPVILLRSAPAIVETGFSQNFLRTLVAHCLKFPARLSRRPLWKLYGGWEVILQREAA